MDAMEAIHLAKGTATDKAQEKTSEEFKKNFIHLQAHHGASALTTYCVQTE